MSLMNPFYPKHAVAFKGASSPSSGGGAASVAAATPAAPPSTTMVEVQQASRDAKKQASRRKGLQSTILAGETGGYDQSSKSTVLGNVGGS